MSEQNTKTVCVAGVSGLVGSNITRAALLRGYRVNGTMRDITDETKTSYLQALDKGKNLSLYEANMENEGDFHQATKNVDCVFIATLIPVYHDAAGKQATEMDDEEGYEKIIMPTVNGCLNIMRTSVANGVENFVICSSTSSTNPKPAVPFKNEIDHWSDSGEQCQAKKYTSATKTVMEKAAIAFAEEQGLRLSIILPTGMFGPLIIPNHMNGNPHMWLRRLINGEVGRHEDTPNDSTSMSHIHDLANLFLAAYENPKACGRYFGVYGVGTGRIFTTKFKSIFRT